MAAPEVKLSPSRTQGRARSIQPKNQPLALGPWPLAKTEAQTLICRSRAIMAVMQSRAEASYEPPELDPAADQAARL
jgi:hypothetical protein